MGGMVVVNGRKVKRGKRRMVMEVRSLEGVGVGFVGCCQIVYAG